MPLDPVCVESLLTNSPLRRNHFVVTHSVSRCADRCRFHFSFFVDFFAAFVHRRCPKGVPVYHPERWPNDMCPVDQYDLRLVPKYSVRIQLVTKSGAILPGLEGDIT